MNSSTALRQGLYDFRTALHRCFGRRADALFEISDALLTAGPLTSPVHLSLEPVHHRSWGSFYAALARGQIDVGALRALVARHPLEDGRPVYAVDASVWARCDAETSPARGFYYHPSRHSAGQPIVAGWAYQWIAQLAFTRDSWSAPVDVRRLHPSENASIVAAEQIKALLCHRSPAGPAPLFVFDAGYDPVQLGEALGGATAAILVRLRSGRCFYADPPVYSGIGRPRRHGRKFTCQDPATWPIPSAEHVCEDDQYGRVRVRTWAGLHAKTQDHPTRGTRQPRPIQRGTLVLVEVTRLPGRMYRPQVLWLWWQGPGEPDLDQLWRAYVRRFDLEHTFRFLKQTLGWTTPRFRHPEARLVALRRDVQAGGDEFAPGEGIDGEAVFGRALTQDALVEESTN